MPRDDRDLPDTALEWRFTHLGNGNEFRSRLALRWELNGDPMSGDYLPEETTAEELWNRWAAHYAEPVMAIYWFIDGSDAGKFEGAPFLEDAKPLEEDFLSFYTWPVTGDDDRPLRFTELPVVDKLWRPGRSDKGGFIQEHTGWKPSPSGDREHLADRTRGQRPVPGLPGLRLAALASSASRIRPARRSTAGG